MNTKAQLVVYLTYLIKCIDQKAMSHEYKANMDALIKASICNIIRSDEVQYLIDDGNFKSVDDYRDMQKDGVVISPHLFTE